MVKRWGVRSLWLFILSLTYVAILPFCTWHSVRSSSQTRPTVLAKMWRPYCWVQNNFTIQSSFTLILTLELSGITWPQASLKWIVKVISENQSNQNSIVKQTTKTLISIFCSTNICCCDLHFMLQEICHGLLCRSLFSEQQFGKDLQGTIRYIFSVKKMDNIGGHC